MCSSYSGVQLIRAVVRLEKEMENLCSSAQIIQRPAKEVISRRGKNANGCKMHKSENRSRKARKATVCRYEICKFHRRGSLLVPEAKERLLTSRGRFVVCRLLQEDEIRRSKLFVFVAGKVLLNSHEFASILQLAVRTRYHPQQRVLNFVDQSNNL